MGPFVIIDATLPGERRAWAVVDEQGRRVGGIGPLKRFKREAAARRLMEHMNKFRESLAQSSTDISNPAAGVRFVLGIRGTGARRRSEVQSVLFDKAHWSLADARRWLRDHKFKSGLVDEKENTYRFRQKSPGLYKEFSTIEAGAPTLNPFKEARLEQRAGDWFVIADGPKGGRRVIASSSYRERALNRAA